MATVRDVITRALLTANVNGVGQTPSAEDMNYGFTSLNNMLAIWSKRRWLVYHLVDTALQSTGAQSYTIGAGGAFNIPRPDRIESAFVRLASASGASGAVDYHLEIIQAREDYNLITLKSLQSFPSVLFYDSGYPLGTLYIWPVPGASFEIHISTKDTLGAYASLSDTVTIPPEYMEAIDYNLCIRLCIGYGQQVQPSMAALAKAALAAIRGANAQIGQLKMPAALMNYRGGGGMSLAGSGGFPDISTLPTTLPAASGVYWNNGGVLSIS